jgi:hypothetical protein
MAHASLTKAHNKLQELSWEPTFVQRAQKYPTDYRLDRSPKKDPLKQIMQSYFPMTETFSLFSLLGNHRLCSTGTIGSITRLVGGL